ncbi:MAG TPA: amino acid aminotransferase [Candidatus Hydrogenedentes bacterium]|nr:aspartate/tyrosine/aromatic aminotransferase [Candidatus Hydrogenedentota bacterium]HOC69543.1 amino acid aminotransferase [Candidatus Hydrogenedentota bacterium]
MFEQIEMAPADAILGLTDAFKKDPNPNKINLGVGIYKDGDGGTPTLESVRKAEKRIFELGGTKTYLPIPGSPAFGEAVRTLLFGETHPVIQSRRACTAHTPGGTGALRVASDFIRRCFGPVPVWVCNPTWANHAAIFEAAGLSLKTYPYYNAEAKNLDFTGMLNALERAETGEVILLHACCHNPSGVDLNPDQWREAASLIKRRGLLPLVDFAYQGFGDGLDEDAAGVRLLCESVDEVLVCTSYSKNFGLYRERCGALTLVAASEDRAERAFSHVEKAIRANYSNPPAHGGEIVTTVLNDPELQGLWRNEVTAMRNRINGMRVLLVDTLKDLGVTQDFSFIKQQRGMFSFSGLSREQVAALRDQYAIYIVGSGRINVAGITETNVLPLCRAIVDIL